MNNEPTLAVTAYSTLYVPVYTLDSGLVWRSLDPETTVYAAKSRLKSVLPEGYRLKTTAGIRCGLLIVKLQSLVGHEMFAEFSAEDFINDVIPTAE